MLHFPVFDLLDVDGYGLYPGELGHDPGLHIPFQSGLTLILGANGLGKTTLVTMLYRLLTGPFDIPGLSGRADVGTVNLQPKSLSSSDRAIFSQRVSDGARDAVARLTFHLGNRVLVVERRLRDLSLTRFSVDGQDLATNETDSFQIELPRLVGVWSFGDWILALRHLVFYFEDRRALVWDPSAQRQILRVLLLPADTARTWTEKERKILELDSAARNLSAILYQQESAQSRTELKLQTAADVRAELRLLEDLHRVDIPKREQLEEGLVDFDARRQAARLRLHTVRQTHEDRFRALEHARLTAIEARFPQRSETARYILAHLMTEAACLVCGNHVPAAAAALEERIKHERCVVCDSDISQSERQIQATKVADYRVEKADISLAALESERAEASREVEDLDRAYESLVSEIAQLGADIAERSARIDTLVRRLPPEEKEVHARRAELATMRGSLESMRQDLADRRQDFGTFVSAESRAMVERSAEIVGAFAGYAEGFLLEACKLIWAPQRARLGQAGDLIDFPAFELEMTGASFPLPVRRSGPEQVSESQREFIDLAFRMALMEIAGSHGVGSLVIDAPESSLDAIFVGRAADVLSRFAEPNRDNRLVITSNLIDGGLLPKLLHRSSTPGDRSLRLVNLFKIAQPTAAIRLYQSEYDNALAAMLEPVDRAPENGGTALAADHLEGSGPPTEDGHPAPEGSR